MSKAKAYLMHLTRMQVILNLFLWVCALMLMQFQFFCTVLNKTDIKNNHRYKICCVLFGFVAWHLFFPKKSDRSNYNDIESDHLGWSLHQTIWCSNHTWLKATSGVEFKIQFLDNFETIELVNNLTTSNGSTDDDDGEIYSITSFANRCSQVKSKFIKSNNKKIVSGDAQLSIWLIFFSCCIIRNSCDDLFSNQTRLNTISISLCLFPSLKKWCALFFFMCYKMHWYYYIWSKRRSCVATVSGELYFIFWTIYYGSFVEDILCNCLNVCNWSVALYTLIVCVCSCVPILVFFISIFVLVREFYFVSFHIYCVFAWVGFIFVLILNTLNNRVTCISLSFQYGIQILYYVDVCLYVVVRLSSHTRA